MWVLAAALDTSGSGAGRDRALHAVARRLRPPGDQASETTDGDAADPGGDGTGPPADEAALRAAIAAAQALQAVDGPLAEEQERLADQILRRTRAELRAGSGGWLAPLLQLAVGPSRAAEGAGAMVSSYAGHPTCDRLTGAGATAPQPQRELAVLLVALRARGETCPDRRSAPWSAAARPGVGDADRGLRARSSSPA